MSTRMSRFEKKNALHQHYINIRIGCNKNYGILISLLTHYQYSKNVLDCMHNVNIFRQFYYFFLQEATFLTKQTEK